MKNHKILTYLNLFRPASVITMSMFIFLPILLSTKNVMFSALQTLPFVLMLAGEIALNDCCDIEKDRVNKPQRPLVNSNVNITVATIVSIVMIVFGVLLSVFIYNTYISRFLYFFIVTVILSCYNLKLSMLPLFKTIITAIATVITLSFVYTYIEKHVSQYFFLTAAFFFILGRELLMDIRDIDGDKLNNYKTIAVIYGSKKVFVCTLMAFIISTISAFCMLITSFSYLKLLLFIPMVFIEFFCYIRCIKAKNSKEQNKYILILWLPIIFMLLIEVV